MTDDNLHDDPTLERVERMLRTVGPSARAVRRASRTPARDSAAGVPARAARGTGAGGACGGSLPAWRIASAGLALAAVVLAIVAVVGSESGESFTGPERAR